MERYDFKVLGADGTVSARHMAALSDLRSVWSVVADMAHVLGKKDGAGNKGARIIVTNEEGEVVILIGVATACSLPRPQREHNKVSTFSDAAIPPHLPAPMAEPQAAAP